MTKIGHAAPRHPWCAVVDDRHRQIESRHDHSGTDDCETDEIGVHSSGRLRLQGRVTRPSGRESAEGKRCQDDEVAREEGPERSRLQSGEGRSSRTDHERHEIVAEGSDDDRRCHHHHDRPVLADDRYVGARTEDVVGGGEQLGPDRHGEQPAGEEEEQHAEQVLQTNHLVIGGELEIADP